MEATEPITLLVVVGVVLLGTMPGTVQGADDALSRAIKGATGATIGILQQSPDVPSEASKAHFTVRASGVHLRDGFFVTARHAVRREQGGQTVIPKEITVLTTELYELPAVLTGVNDFLDIAVYQLIGNKTSWPTATTQFVDREPEAGEEVFTVGYPLGWGPTVAFGRVGNLNTFLATAESRLIQVDMAACSGNSGGGLFTSKGEALGVVHAIIQTETVQGERRCSRMAFAVPGRLVQRMVNALIEGRVPEFSTLGIRMTAVKRGGRWRVAVAKATGPAKEGGIKKGDMLLAIEDMEITTAAQLKTYLLERTVPSQRVAIRVLRGETEHIFSITLGSS